MNLDELIDQLWWITFYKKQAALASRDRRQVGC